MPEKLSSLAHLENGLQEKGDCGNDELDVPDWVEKDRLKQAQKIYEKYSFSFLFAHLTGLTMLVCLPSILGPVVFTGTSNSVPLIFKRLLSTLQHLRLWYTTDLLDPDSPGRKSLKIVRRMHNKTAKMVNALEDINFKSRFPGVPVSQYDMAMTQFAIFGMLAIHPKRFGLHSCSQYDLECLVHLWRYAGYLLGIDEQYNLAAGSFDDVLINCRDVKHNVMKVALKTASEEMLVKSRGMIEAFSPYFPFLNWMTVLAFMTLIEQRSLGLYQKISLYALHFFMTAMKLNIVRRSLNFALEKRIEKMMLDLKNMTFKKS